MYSRNKIIKSDQTCQWYVGSFSDLHAAKFAHPLTQMIILTHIFTTISCHDIKHKAPHQYFDSIKYALFYLENVFQNKILCVYLQSIKIYIVRGNNHKEKLCVPFQISNYIILGLDLQIDPVRKMVSTLLFHFSLIVPLDFFIFDVELYYLIIFTESSTIRARFSRKYSPEILRGKFDVYCVLVFFLHSCISEHISKVYFLYRYFFINFTQHPHAR